MSEKISVLLRLIRWDIIHFTRSYSLIFIHCGIACVVVYGTIQFVTRQALGDTNKQSYSLLFNDANDVLSNEFYNQCFVLSQDIQPAIFFLPAEKSPTPLLSRSEKDISAGFVDVDTVTVTNQNPLWVTFILPDKFRHTHIQLLLSSAWNNSQNKRDGATRAQRIEANFLYTPQIQSSNASNNTQTYLLISILLTVMAATISMSVSQQTLSMFQSDTSSKTIDVLLNSLQHTIYLTYRFLTSVTLSIFLTLIWLFVIALSALFFSVDVTIPVFDSINLFIIFVLLYSLYNSCVVLLYTILRNHAALTMVLSLLSLFWYAPLSLLSSDSILNISDQKSPIFIHVLTTMSKVDFAAVLLFIFSCTLGCLLLSHSVFLKRIQSGKYI